MKNTKIEWCDTTWNPVLGFNGYYASKQGQILSLKRKHPYIMKPIKSGDGHLYVFAYEKGKQRKLFVHRAVLLAWCGKPAAGTETRHLDDNPDNNSLENLKWGTRQENVDDKRRNGRLPVGERSGTHKLTEGDVSLIKQMAFHEMMSMRKIAQMLDVSHTTIRAIFTGRRWSHLGGTL